MSGSAIVLMYHRVVPTGHAVGDIDIPQEVFAEQLVWMRTAGYEFLDAETFAAERLTRDGRRRVLVTFDDGNRLIYEHAWPVLRDLDIPHTQFVITSAADNKHSEFLSWRQMEAMAQSPRTRFASHSHRHDAFTGGRHDQTGLLRFWEDDLAKSSESLSRLGTAWLSSHLAWPWGYANAAMRQMAKGAGFTTQYMAYPGRTDCIEAVHSLPRITLGGPDCRRYRDKLSFWSGPLALLATHARHAYAELRIKHALGGLVALGGTTLIGLTD